MQEPNIMTAVMGSPPPSTKTEISDFDDRIAKREGLLMSLVWDQGLPHSRTLELKIP